MKKTSALALIAAMIIIIIAGCGNTEEKAEEIIEKKELAGKAVPLNDEILEGSWVTSRVEFADSSLKEGVTRSAERIIFKENKKAELEDVSGEFDYETDDNRVKLLKSNKTYSYDGKFLVLSKENYKVYYEKESTAE
ncbi:MAG: hypothetical protein ACLFQK_06495 [Fibrobacterota bacterium]